VKPAAGGLGLSLLGMAALIGVIVLILRKGPFGGLMVILAIAVALFVVTALAVVFSEDVVSLVAPAENGYLGVLAGHAPLLCSLKPGEIKIRRESGELLYATSGGFMEVTPKKTSILSESTEAPEAIDPARASKARQRAKERLATFNKDVDRSRAEAAAARAENRIRVAQKKR
jgi:F-type H+-transporting ATPase subunit epsilon